MMEPNVSRPARKVGIADHLWDTFEEMAQAMGADRDALINQAMFTFARLNGFLEAGAGRAAGQGARAAPPVLHPVSGGRTPSSPAAPEVTPLPAPAPTRPARATEERAPAPSRTMDEDPSRKEVAERVLETAAELERLIKGKGSDAFDDEDDLRSDEVPMGDEGLPSGEDEALPEEEDVGGHTSQDVGGEDEGLTLYLMTEAGEALPVTKERFVIGRGKHCDFVIQSGKVSREHAVISHDGQDFYIEDLGSSNGTWFNKQRIKRRKVEDGDEYYICSEKIQLVVR